MLQGGVQLHTIRASMKEDLWGSLEKTAEIGYRFVELAGFFEKTPEEWKQKLDQFGLTVIGSHIPIEDAEDNVDAQLDVENVPGSVLVRIGLG